MGHSSELKLPISLITVMDLARIERELAALDDFSIQSSIRQAGTQPQLPRTSRGLEELAEINNFNLLVDQERAELSQLVKDLKTHAPVIHISFAADPKAVFLSKILNWFRSEIQPQILLQVGLQPSIAAGCTVRTANKYFDFSLRQYFDEHRQLLADKLTGD